MPARWAAKYRNADTSTYKPGHHHLQRLHVALLQHLAQLAAKLGQEGRESHAAVCVWRVAGWGGGGQVGKQGW